MRVIMVAPPGAGKGTQGTLIATHFGLHHISTGDLLRQHVTQGTPLGKQVQSLLESGQFVPDDIVLAMVQEEFEKIGPDGGYVLDGIPRTMHQAREAYRIAKELDLIAHVALYLDASDEELTRRLLARAAIEHRSDDTAEVIAQRLATYHEITHPIVDWYRARGILISVDAMRPAEEVGREVLTALEVMRSVIDHVDPAKRRAIDLTGLDRAFGA